MSEKPPALLSPLEKLPYSLPEDYRYLDTSVHWIIEDIMRQEAVMAIGGAPDSFKSWLMLDAVLAIANGLPTFLGQPILKHGPVLVICADDGIHLVADRLKMISRFRLGTEHHDGIALVGRGEFNLTELMDRNRLRNTLISLANDFGEAPVLAVVDTAAMAGMDTEDYGHRVPKELGWLKKLATDLDCCIALTDHVTKPSGDAPGLDVRIALWGSMMKAGFFEAVWLLEKKGQHYADRQSVNIRVSDKRTPEDYHNLLEFAKIKGEYELKVVDAGITLNLDDGKTKAPRPDQTMDDIVAHLGKGASTLPEISAAIGKDYQAVRRRILKSVSEVGPVEVAGYNDAGVPTYQLSVVKVVQT